MKTQEANTDKQARKTNYLPYCKDFQKMAEMMKTCCPSEGGAMGCCSMMMKMMREGAAEEQEQEQNKKGENC